MSQIIPQEYEIVDIDKLQPHPDNPRRGSKAAIAESIETNGFYGAVVAQRSTGYILAGNHRWDVAKEKGLGQLPVCWLDVTEAQAKRILIADNRTAEMATWDEASLAKLLEWVQADTGSLAGTGFDTSEYVALANKLIAENIPPRSSTDLDDAPEPRPDAITVTGDLWLLGSHRLLCGDSTSVDAMERLMDGGQAHTLWTDPPYGVSYVGKTKNKLTIENDGGDTLEELLHGFLAAATIALVPSAPFYIAHPAGAKSLVFGNAVVDAGWRIHETLIWVKDSMVLGHSDYHYRHEPILYGYTPGEGRPGRGNHEGTRWVGDNSQTTVLEVPRPKRSEEHPTMKPVELIRRCLANNTPAGGVVLDPFSGSGSTLAACEQGGYRGRGMELDPHYCDVIIRRWQDLTGKDAVLDSDGLSGGRTFRELAAERMPSAA